MMPPSWSWILVVTSTFILASAAYALAEWWGFAIFAVGAVYGIIVERIG